MDLALYLPSLLGGLCIGLASILLMLTLGRIAGVSGILFTSLKSVGQNNWSVAFIAGLILGAYVFHWVSNRPVPEMDASLPVLLTGGLIVGIGTRLGRGCTSGHGVCGLARLSARSIAATATFMTTAAVTVYVVLHGGLI